VALHWSAASEEVKRLAAEMSTRWKHHYLSTEHFFFAACSLDERCSAWLTRRGLSVAELQEDILRLVPEGDEVAPWEGLIESPRIRRIMTKGCQTEAEGQRSMKVEPVHLVAAILAEGNNVAVRVLALRGHKASACRQDLFGSSTSAPATASPAQPAAKPGKEKYLTKYGRDLTAQAREGKMDPVIGRNDEVRRVLQILTRKTKSNPVLVGEAGVGKSAVALGLAQRIAAGQVPDILKDRRVIELSLSSMIAGASNRGDFEERLEGVVKEASADPKIVLFIDEIHQLVGAGRSGGMDASNILKPALARGDFPVLGCTTTDEYRRYIEADPALERRFQPVLVGEPSEADALEILKGLKSRYEAHHGVTFTDSALLAAVKLSVRFLPDRNLPDKAIDLIDESAARVKTRSGVYIPGERPQFEVNDEVIAEVVADWTGIPVSRMTEEESSRLLEMESLLRKRVVGQDHAVEAVSQTIRVVRVGLTSPNRPGGVFLFLGPSGVGKTELAKGLAEFLFGSDTEMVRIDMSEYHDKSSVARLIGSPPGYVGYEEEGQLTKAVRTKPYCVVLLDEVEKAHPEVFDIFLQVFDDGRLTDSKGRTVNFCNTLIVLTSNLGARAALSQAVPDNKGMAGQMDQLPNAYQEALRGHFRPEFINRIDEIILFRALERSDLVGIVRIHLGKLIKTLTEREIQLVVEDSAVELLLEVGYQPAYGARPLQRAIDSMLKRPMAEEMLRQKLGPGSTLAAYRAGDKLAFRVVQGGPVGGTPPVVLPPAPPARPYSPPPAVPDATFNDFGAEDDSDYGNPWDAPTSQNPPDPRRGPEPPRREPPARPEPPRAEPRRPEPPRQEPPRPEPPREPAPPWSAFRRPGE
jgi:ATP-dependent Clp protease ATP-binding subunit ClpC